MTGHRHSLQGRKHSGPHLMYMECIFQDYVVGEQKKSQQWLSSKLDQDPILYSRKPCENMSCCHFVKCTLCPDLTLYNVLMAPDMFINPFTSLPKYAKIKGLWNTLEYSHYNNQPLVNFAYHLHILTKGTITSARMYI